MLRNTSRGIKGSSKILPIVLAHLTLGVRWRYLVEGGFQDEHESFESLKSTVAKVLEDNATKPLTCEQKKVIEELGDKCVDEFLKHQQAAGGVMEQVRADHAAMDVCGKMWERFRLFENRIKRYGAEAAAELEKTKTSRKQRKRVLERFHSDSRGEVHMCKKLINYRLRTDKRAFSKMDKNLKDKAVAKITDYCKLCQAQLKVIAESPDNLFRRADDSDITYFEQVCECYEADWYRRVSKPALESKTLTPTQEKQISLFRELGADELDFHVLQQILDQDQSHALAAILVAADDDLCFLKDKPEWLEKICEALHPDVSLQSLQQLVAEEMKKKTPTTLPKATPSEDDEARYLYRLRKVVELTSRVMIPFETQSKFEYNCVRFLTEDARLEPLRARIETVLPNLETLLDPPQPTYQEYERWNDFWIDLRRDKKGFDKLLKIVESNDLYKYEKKGFWRNYSEPRDEDPKLSLAMFLSQIFDHVSLETLKARILALTGTDISRWLTPVGEKRVLIPAAWQQVISPKFKCMFEEPILPCAGVWQGLQCKVDPNSVLSSTV